MANVRVRVTLPFTSLAGKHQPADEIDLPVDTDDEREQLAALVLHGLVAADSAPLPTPTTPTPKQGGIPKYASLDAAMAGLTANEFADGDVILVLG